MQLLIIPVQGFTQGIQPIISYNFGAKKYDRVTETVNKSIRITFGTTILYYILVLLFPQLFANIFTKNRELIQIVKNVLPIFMAGMWLFGIQMSAQMFFLGTGQAGKSLFIALLRKIIILIPLAIILPNFFGVLGVFYAEPVADIISATTSGFLLFFSLKKLKK